MAKKNGCKMETIHTPRQAIVRCQNRETGVYTSYRSCGLVAGKGTSYREKHGDALRQKLGESVTALNKKLRRKKFQLVWANFGGGSARRCRCGSGKHPNRFRPVSECR